MAKRPLLSTNLQISAKPRHAEALLASGGGEASEARSIAFESRVLAQPAPRHPPRSLTIKGQDTLADIMGDAVVTLSLASAVGWAQCLNLQYRLSSYVLTRSSSLVVAP